MLPAMVDHRTVWQTSKEQEKHDEGDWLRKNGGKRKKNGEGGWEWKSLGDKEADEWVVEVLGTRKEGEKKSVVEKGWEALELGILRSDALRYLVLLCVRSFYLILSGGKP